MTWNSHELATNAAKAFGKVGGYPGDMRTTDLEPSPPDSESELLKADENEDCDIEPEGSHA